MNPAQPKIAALRADCTAIVASWGEALSQPKTEHTRDSAILRFELSYEVTWKLLQASLRDQGHEVSSPRQAFQHAFSIGWISDEQVWDDIIRARNIAVHAYREADAERLFGELERFHRAFPTSPLPPPRSRPAAPRGETAPTANAADQNSHVQVIVAPEVNHVCRENAMAGESRSAKVLSLLAVSPPRPRVFGISAKPNASSRT